VLILEANINKEDQIIKDYGKRSPALTVDEITSKFKISNKELYKTLKKHNVPKRGRVKIPPKNPKHDLVGKRYHHPVGIKNGDNR